MKITKLELIHIKPRWLFLKLYTDEGIVGYGEPVVEGRSTVVEEAVRVYGEMIKGMDPLDIQHIWQYMYRGTFYRGGAVLVSAISGIEQALWDIKGKYYGVPVWQLLGGKCRDRIRAYAHISPDRDGASIEEYTSLAKNRVEQGFTALKMPADFPLRPLETQFKLESYVEKVAAVREAIGPHVDLALDFHGRVSPANAIRLCRMLEPYFPMFIEEPCLPENVDTMVKIRESTSIPIATGERLLTKWGFREAIEKQVAEVYQPDLSHAGGILETIKIAAMAENYYASIAPHNPLGPIALASCLQVDTCIPNFIAQEHPTTSTGHDLGKTLFKEPFKIVDGYFEIPQKPGLGFEIIEEGLEKLRFDGKWTCPTTFQYDDNSVGDW